jgi:glycosyltransferase involved in cell wall biosynthesis
LTDRPTILYLGTYERDYPRNQQIIRLLRKCDCRVEEIHEPFWERFRDKSRGFGGPGALVFLLFRLVVIYLKLFVRLLTRIRSVDAVVIGYIGQLDMLMLGSVSRLFKVPVIFNPLVTLTDTIVEDRELARTGSAQARVIRAADWISLRLANLVLVDTAQNADYLFENFDLPRSRIGVVHVGADEEIFVPSASVFERSCDLHVLFYGKMIPLHGVQTILDAVAVLQQRGDDDVRFEIIGSGQQEEIVQRFAVEHPELSVTFRNWVAYRRLPQRIASADIVLGVFGAGEKASRVIPNKVFQAMAVGKPIITQNSPAVRCVLRHGDSAMLIPPADPEALAEAISELRDPERRKALAADARNAFLIYGSDNAGAAALKTILHPILPSIVCEMTSGRCS